MALFLKFYHMYVIRTMPYERSEHPISENQMHMIRMLILFNIDLYHNKDAGFLSFQQFTSIYA